MAAADTDTIIGKFGGNVRIDILAARMTTEASAALESVIALYCNTD